MINQYYKLLYLLPVGLITGPFIPDLIISVCIILFLFDTYRLKLFFYFNNNFFKLFLLFCLFLNISSLLSDNISSIKYSLSYLRFGIFSVFVFYVLKNYDRFKLYFGYSIISVFLFLSIDSLIQLIFGKNIFLFKLQIYNNGLSYITSTFNEEKKLGSFIARIFPLFLVSVILLKNRINLLYKYKEFIIIIPLLLVILSTERVSLFIICFSFFILIFKSSIFFRNKFSIVLLICPIIILFTFNPILLEKFISTFYSIGILNPGLNDAGEIRGGYIKGFFIFSKFHEDQLLNCIKLFSENIFTGVGPKNYKFYSNEWHPHNFHGQIIAELGIFAYLLFLIIFLNTGLKLINLFSSKKNLVLIEELKLLILCSIFVNFLPIPSGDFFNNWLNIIIYLPIGYYLYLNEKKKI